MIQCDFFKIYDKYIQYYKNGYVVLCIDACIKCVY